MSGYIQLYTGNGKGKTTAALGLSLRAVGANKRVLFAQFVKGRHYSELNSLARFPEIEIRQYGLDCFIEKAPTELDVKVAKKGLEEVAEAIIQHKYDVIVMDEVCIALYYHLFEIEELVSILHQKPDEMELVLTGRYAPAELYDIADLVTEMREYKHYYQRGIQAREGIEY